MKLVISLATLGLVLVACKAENPALTGTAKPAPPVSYAAARPDPFSETHPFEFKASYFTAEQAKYDKNTISVLFEVRNDKGESVNKIPSKAFEVFENGRKVSPFTITGNEKTLEKVAEIALVVDITNSMDSFINNAKTVLSEFIHSSRERNYKVRFCLSTFGDRVVQACDRFYDNQNDDSIRELVSNITKLYAHKGSDDPGGKDVPENSMRALVEATKAPWSPDADRFVVLVTDADFYSHDKTNDALRAKHLEYHDSIPEEVAPTQADVTQAIQSSGVRVFAVVPGCDRVANKVGGARDACNKNDTPVAGYSAPWANGQADIVTASKGKFFDFYKTVVVGKQGGIAEIFESILRLVSTTYKLDYVEEDVGGAPNLKVTDRKIEIKTSAGTVTAKPANSTMPEGRPEYKQAWSVDARPIDAKSLRVKMNGVPVDPSELQVNGGEVRWSKTAPPPGAKLEFSFFYKNNADNLRIEPVAIKGQPAPETVRVVLNDQLAVLNRDYTLDKSADGNTLVNFTSAIVDASDRFKLYEKKRIDVKVTTNWPK